MKHKAQNTTNRQFTTQPAANEKIAKRLQKHNGNALKKIVERFRQTASCVQTIVVSPLDKMNLSNKLADNKAPPELRFWYQKAQYLFRAKRKLFES